MSVDQTVDKKSPYVAATEGLDGDTVSKYLNLNPEFFVVYEDLLPRLRIPHSNGKAVSLIEKQVDVLRGQCSQLENRLAELISVARHNEALQGRLHTLIQDIISAASIDDIVSLTRHSLLTNFNADQVRIYLNPSVVGQDTSVMFDSRSVDEDQAPGCEHGDSHVTDTHWDLDLDAELDLSLDLNLDATLIEESILEIDTETVEMEPLLAKLDSEFTTESDSKGLGTEQTTVDDTVSGTGSAHVRVGNGRQQGLNDDRVLPIQDADMVHFQSVFDHRQTICGTPTADQLDALGCFDSDEVGSAALVPLWHGAPLGLVMISSSDKTRFDSGKGVMFLNQLGELLSRRLHSLGVEPPGGNVHEQHRESASGVDAVGASVDPA